MIRSQTIARFLTEKLNEISVDDEKYTFEISAEVGHNYKILHSAQIQGRLKIVEPSNPPTVGFINNTTRFSLELIVPSANGANKHVLNVMEILGQLIVEINGKSQDLDGGQVLISIDGAIIPSEIKNISTIGQGSIINVNLMAQYSVDLTTYNNYVVDIKIPGLIEEYINLPLLNIDHNKHYSNAELSDVINIDDGLDYNQNFKRTILVRFYATNNVEINSIIDNFLLDETTSELGTNDLIYLRIKRHNTTREYKVKIADIASSTPNGLGFEIISITFTKYSLEDEMLEDEETEE